MKVLTHLAAAEATWFAASALFEVSYPPEAMLVAAGASLLPDIDYPESWIGYLAPGISQKIEERWGKEHRGFFHSLLGLLAFGLLLYPLYLSDHQVLWWAAMAGYWSHLWVDMMSLTGVRLFWPSDLRAVFPGRDEFRIRTGSSRERIFFFLLVGAALLLYPVSRQGLSSVISPGPQDPAWVRVLRVIDGDTIVVELWGSETKVRLIGVDTPETVAPGQPVGCYGPEASAFTKSKLEGRIVKLMRSTFGDVRDAYGRLLAYVFIDVDGDGELDDFNLELLRRGYARITGFNHDLRRQYREAMLEAQKAKRGLWGACD